MVLLKEVFIVGCLVVLGEALTKRELSLIANYNTEKCGVLTVGDASGGTHLVSSTGLPNHPWWRTNPNAPQARSRSYSIPSSPTKSSTPYCLPGGIIGYAINGVAIFNFLTSGCKNAVEGCDSETFDGCGGHPDANGVYHYHKAPDMGCLFGASGIPLTDTLFGVALDGFPIYIKRSIYRTGSGLDECHGKNVRGKYRYYITEDFPYTLGCFRGEPASGVNSNMCTDTAVEGMCACRTNNCNGPKLYRATDEGMSGCPAPTSCRGAVTEAPSCSDSWPVAPSDVDNCDAVNDCTETCTKKRGKGSDLERLIRLLDDVLKNG